MAVLLPTEALAAAEGVSAGAASLAPPGGAAAVAAASAALRRPSTQLLLPQQLCTFLQHHAALPRTPADLEEGPERDIKTFLSMTCIDITEGCFVFNSGIHKACFMYFMVDLKINTYDYNI